MELEQIIDAVILDIFPLMPSTGTWPFTMVRVDRNKLSGLETDKILFASAQLLVLKRTDFTSEDLLDYAINSKEYNTLSVPLKSGFLENYNKMIDNEEELQEWMDKTISLAIGLVIQTALNKALQFTPVEANLSVLDTQMELGQKNLRAYQLFDVYQLDPSFLI